MGTHNQNKHSISADLQLVIILIVVFLVVGIGSIISMGTI